MTTSRIPALIDYLVTTFTAAPAFAPLAGQTSPQVLVLDGPAVTDDPTPLVLHVGLSDAIPQPGQQPPVSADSQQSHRPGLGITKREEIATIHCTAVAWAGSEDPAGVKTVRTSAFAVLATVEDLVRTDTTKFGGNGDLAEPGVSGLVLQQNTTPQGAIAQVMFSITIKCFIGS